MNHRIQYNCDKCNIKFKTHKCLIKHDKQKHECTLKVLSLDKNDEIDVRKSKDIQNKSTHNESILKLPDVQNNIEENFTNENDRILSDYEIRIDEISDDEETEMSDATNKDIEEEISDDENKESNVPASYRYLCPISDCVYFCLSNGRHIEITPA